MIKLLLVSISCLILNVSWAQNQITTSVSGTNFCTNQTYPSSVQFTPVGVYNLGNSFIAQLSNANGNFSTGITEIGRLDSAVTGNTIPITIPASITASNSYRIRVTATDPGTIGTDNGTNLSIQSRHVVTIQTGNTTVCPGQLVYLTAFGASNYTWTAGNNGSYNQIMVDRPNTTTTYTVEGSYTAGCRDQASITLNVLITPDPAFSYSSPLYCQGVSNPVPVVQSGASGVFTASPTGLVFANDSTGEIDLAASQPNSYTITFTTNSTCPRTYNQTISINSNATRARFTYGQAICEDAGIRNPAYIQGGVAGSFSATPAGLVFTSGSTPGQISVYESQLGTYYVTNSVPAQGQCQAATYTDTITIYPVPQTPVVIGTSQVCEGETIYLTALHPNSNASYTWHGPNGFNANLQFPIIPNASMANSGTYSVIVTAHGCQSQYGTFTVQVGPERPSIISNSPLVQGSTLTLSAALYNYTGQYSWSGPDSLQATEATLSLPNVTMQEAGTYTVSTGSGQCSQAYHNVQVLSQSAIIGNIYRDVNNNGQYDYYEQPWPNRTLVAQPGNYYGLTDADGNYIIEVPPGIYSVTLGAVDSAEISNPGSLQVSITNSSQVAQGNDIGIFSTSQDLAVYITTTTPRPGYTFYYKVAASVFNYGNTAMSGSVALHWDSTLTIYRNYPNPNVNGNPIIWNFTNLQPFTGQVFNTEFIVPATTPLGTPVQLRAVVTPINGDYAPQNNEAMVTDTVVGSYDPNDKQVQPAGDITPDFVEQGKELTYTIRFQNTGTDTAFTVVIADTLSQLLNIGSFKMISSSHACTPTLRSNGILNCTFANILLPDSNRNEPASHGYLQYSIRPKAGIEAGEVIKNTAYIFFDFNEAIVTNTTRTPITAATGLAELTDNNALQVYPNPSKGQLMFSVQEADKLEVRLINTLGQPVLKQDYTIQTNSKEQQLDLHNLPVGMYMLQVLAGHKIYSRRVVLQR